MLAPTTHAISSHYLEAQALPVLLRTYATHHTHDPPTRIIRDLQVVHLRHLTAAAALRPRNVESVMLLVSSPVTSFVVCSAISLVRSFGGSN
jgi:hypothetical protein